MVGGLLSRINHSHSKALAWVLLLIFDIIVIYFYANSAKLFIVVPVVVFNLVIITVLLYVVEKRVITSYIVQMEAAIVAMFVCNMLGEMSDWLAILTAVLYLVFAYYFYRRTVKKK
jgi:hypothetical protein